MPIRGTEGKTELDKERLRELAFVDDLTELYNRRYLYQYLPSELKAVQRLDKELSLFMIDVDNFKQVNDAYGHLCGDKILVEIAEILRKSFRQGDTVIRYAGDEFVAILPGAKEEIAINIAKRIVDLLEKPESLIKFVSDRMGHDKRYALDCGKIHSLGWKPAKKFEEALAFTVRWYRKNPEWWRKIKEESKDFQEFYSKYYAKRK